MHNDNNVLNSKCQLAIDKQSVLDNLGRCCGPVMTTVEISDLTGKEHRNVLRDTKGMLTELYGADSLLRFEQSYRASNGQHYKCYALPKKEILVLVSGYSIKLRMRIITRLEELEKAARDPMAVLNNPAILRTALLNYSEKILVLEEKVRTDEPKVAALDRLATADGSFNVTSGAKHLGVRPKILFKFMEKNGWIYRRAGSKNWLGYQTRVQAGYLEHKVTTMSYGDGTERIYEQVRITGKGLAKLAEIFERTEA